MNQNQLATLFDTSVPNISMHISNILEENELYKNSVIKDYLSTAADGKNYKVCLLYTSDAADERSSVDLGGRRIIKKKKKKKKRRSGGQANKHKRTRKLNHHEKK